ncbi:site-specific integrase [Streptococcus suis]
MIPAIYQNGLNTLGERLAKETLVKFHHQCKSSLKYAIHDGLISKNFAELAKVSSTSDTGMDEKKKYLELDEYKSLLRKLRLLTKHKRYLFLYVLAVSGLRYAEGKALNKNTIDFENNVFIVKNAWNDQKKSIGQLKNIHSERRVPFNNTKKRMLQYYFRMHLEDKKFFTTLQKRDMNNLLKSLVGRDVHLHTLRHTYVSYLASEKVDVNTIARLVGHKDATTTLKNTRIFFRNLRANILKK